MAELSGDSDEREPWTTQDSINLESGLEAMMLDKGTLTACEDCLRIMGFQGNHKWIQGMTCDICGENEFCGVFGPNDTLAEGDVYDNDVQEEPAEGEALRCVSCGIFEDPKLKSAGQLCPEVGCPGTLQFISANDMDLDNDKSGMLICNECGTNWQENWGIYCGKCHQGFKKVQYIPQNQRNHGSTVKVCDTCGVEWSERVGSTTCSKCDWGKPAYRLIVNSIPDVPTREGYPASEDREDFEPLRRYVPNHETGKLELVSGPRKNPQTEEDPELYRFRGED